MIRSSFSVLSLLAVVTLFAGCDGVSPSASPPLIEGECAIPVDQVVSGGVGKDGIPSLSNPTMVQASAATYLDDNSRVIGLILDGVPIAVPHNILWWHEIVNLDGASTKVAVSYCPLTGSSIAFDRSPQGGAEFGVSGLLWQNNLIMYDRNTNESLWPQMSLKAGCGDAIGSSLQQIPTWEMAWARWQELYPETRVISSETGFLRNYSRSGYPYGNYESPNNSTTLFDQQVNVDRPPKERVLGIPSGSGGRTYPFFELDSEGLRNTVNEVVDGEPVVIFWEDAAASAIAFQATHNGQVLHFTPSENGFVDEETGSTWQFDGTAISGDLAGAVLRPVDEAYVAFWFAWKAFQPELTVWTRE